VNVTDHKSLSAMADKFADLMDLSESRKHLDHYFKKGSAAPDVQGIYDVDNGHGLFQCANGKRKRISSQGGAAVHPSKPECSNCHMQSAASSRPDDRDHDGRELRVAPRSTSTCSWSPFSGLPGVEGTFCGVLGNGNEEYNGLSGTTCASTMSGTLHSDPALGTKQPHACMEAAPTCRHAAVVSQRPQHSLHSAVPMSCFIESRPAEREDRDSDVQGRCGGTWNDDVCGVFDLSDEGADWV
jgi:hypothetical protein